MAEEKSPQWAMATPAVLYMVGCATLMLFALLSGLVNPGAVPAVAILFVVCGIATLILGTIELRRGDLLLGSIDMVFGALIFLGVGAVLGSVAWGMIHLAQTPAGAPPPVVAIYTPDLAIAAYLAIGIAIALFLFLPCVGKVSWALFLSFIVLAAAAIVLAIGLLVNANFGDAVMWVSGILFLIFGLFAYYAGSVFIVNTVYQAPKLPIGKPCFK
jgi:hypothetical protein